MTDIDPTTELVDSLVSSGGGNQAIQDVDRIVDRLESVELTPEIVETLTEKLQSVGISIEPEDVELPIVSSAPSSFSGSLTDPIKAYLQTIGRIPLLTPQQEKRAAEQMLEGQKAAERLLELSLSIEPSSTSEIDQLKKQVAKGMEARSVLVESNLRLVVSIAKRYRHRGMSFLDLIQEGNAGLVRAVEKFDHTRGFKVSTYATWWIRQAMSRAIADQSRTIRIPVHVYDALGRVMRAQRAMLQELGREPSLEELATRMQLPIDKVKDILMIDHSTVSFESSGSSSGEEYDLHDLIADEHVQSPDAVASHQALHEMLIEAMEILGEREGQLMEMRFGLNDGRTHSLEEVGKAFGVTRERVRQIETKILNKLRTPLARKQVEEFLQD